MKEQPSNPCEKVSFILTYDQLEAAYNIYREQFISCDFIRRSMERLEERIGLCNLPYETLRDDPSLLHEAYLQFLRLEDCNVAYNDTLEQVIDAIEQWLASGTLSPVNLTRSSSIICQSLRLFSSNCPRILSNSLHSIPISSSFS